jgi:hypothetical protein
MARTDRNTRTRPRGGDRLPSVLCRTKKIYSKWLDEHYIEETYRQPCHVPGTVLQERRAADSMRDQLLDHQLERELGTVEDELNWELGLRHMNEMYDFWFGDVVSPSTTSSEEKAPRRSFARPATKTVEPERKDRKRRFRSSTSAVQPDGSIKRTRRVTRPKTVTSSLPPHLRDPECAERR